jgi:hypothetical protein
MQEWLFLFYKNPDYQPKHTLQDMSRLLDAILSWFRCIPCLGNAARHIARQRPTHFSAISSRQGFIQCLLTAAHSSQQHGASEMTARSCVKQQTKPKRASG